MSLQRVLETARRTGLPVIVTDVAGREPMVILPLEQFEAMAGEGAPVAEPIVRATQRVAPTHQDDPVDRALAEMTAERLRNRMEQAAVELEGLTDQAHQNHEIPLEERFYLEPVEDKNEM